MDHQLQNFLAELEQFGQANDRAMTERYVEEMAPFVALVEADTSFTTSLVPVGNGEFLAVKALT